MCTKRQLKEYLAEISNGAKFKKFDYVSAEKFTVILKCKIEESEADYNNYVKQWIRKFSEFTNTAWIVRNCFPNLKRLVYRKSFWCHRSAQNKSKTSERTRNLECKAKIDFRIKFINRNTLRNDPDLKEGLNMNISIDFTHSHLVRAQESFNLLKSSSQSDSAFDEYFNAGYTPSVAKCYHELLLIEKYGQDSEYIANASTNPSIRHVLYLYQKKSNKDVDINQVIQKKIDSLQQSGHIIKYNSNPQFLVIITPLMQRVLTPTSVERLLIDVTTINAGLFVMMIYVPYHGNSLPIASVILTEQSKARYTQIFSYIFSAIDSSFGKRFEPMLVCHSNSLVKEAISSIFPNVVIKLYRYTICRDIWEWICGIDNKIDKGKRHEIMTLFKSLVYANSIEDAIVIHSDLLSNKMMQSCLHKLEHIWHDRQLWITNEEFSGTHIETLLIFVKEFFIQKCKSFTFRVMMDVVTNILECHFQKMLMVKTDNEVTALNTKFLPKANIVFSSESTQRVGQSEFIVPSESKRQKFYRLSTETLCCDCKNGIKGIICEHLIGVLNAIDTKCTPEFSEDHKNVLFQIAGNVGRIKDECENDNFDEASEVPITVERPMSSSSKASDFYTEMKAEDPLDENQGNNINNDEIEQNFKLQYEAAMKTVNDEFRRLNKLFKENPNKANKETMIRLAKELAKIRPVEVVDFSNMFVKLNS